MYLFLLGIQHYYIVVNTGIIEIKCSETREDILVGPCRLQSIPMTELGLLLYLVSLLSTSMLHNRT